MKYLLLSLLFAFVLSCTTYKGHRTLASLDEPSCQLALEYILAHHSGDFSPSSLKAQLFETLTKLPSLLLKNFKTKIL